MASSANPFDVLTGLGAPAAKNGMMFQNPLSVVDRITSNFGPRSSPNVGGGRRGSSNHKGTDLAEAGQAGYAVEAAGAGTVTFAGNKGGYGLTIEVTHPNGYKTQYSHLESLNAKVGDEIQAGTPVGKVGNTGKSSGPHLHFEVKDPTGKAVNPKSVTDLATNRSLSVTPSPRPSDDLGALMSFAPTTMPSMPSMPDMSRFGPETVSRGPSMQSSPMGMVSSPVGPTGGFARAEAPMGFAREPSPDRFGYNVADIDPSRFGYTPEPSASRFGYGMAQNVASPVSPAGSYAVASAPNAAPAPTGGLGGLGGMTSTPKADRLSTPMSAAASTPMASNPSKGLSAGLGYYDLTGVPTVNASTVSVSPSSMGLLPSTAKAPAGPASTFTAMPTNVNALSPASMMQNARLTPANLPTIPTIAPPAVQPMVAPATPAVTRQPVSNITTGAVRSAPPTPPMATAMDVYSGRATQGVASNGATVSRDPVTGNVSVTNAFGATTVTDPSGRQMGNLGGLGKGIGAMMDKVSPGMVGSVIGGAIAGMPGSVIGGMIGNKMGGQQAQQSGQKTGGLGGLGGFLADLFGGGSSSGGRGGGGGSSSSGSRSGGSSSGGRASPGSDRSQAGNN
jgi:hypothetical protein